VTTVYVLNREAREVTAFSDYNAAEAIAVMRRMRWVKVRRHGKKGSRWYVLSMRNRQEWKLGYTDVDGHRVRIE
jgi:hypothetical protein